MEKLAEIFGNPQEKLKIIHVAGTNGKGSVCAMLAKIFEKNNYKTGLFTSPHIKSYTERFKINFKNISKNKFAQYFQLVETTAQKNNINLTEFELLTMMAFLYFYDEKVDILLLETGMGGRLDATNIVKHPVLTIITSISFDHADRLGKTIEDIAYEKSGILKINTPVVISTSNKGFKIIEKRAQEINAVLLPIENDFKLIDIKENIFSNNNKSYKLSLKGLNQGENLALVEKVREYMNLQENNALADVAWSCRMQFVVEKNLLVDAAHNSNAVKILKKNLEKYYKNKKRVFLFGVLNTKDYKNMIKNLFDKSDTIYVTDSFAQNSIDKIILAKEIAKIFPESKIKLIELENINEFTEKDVIEGIKICCGSFYLCSKVL